MNLLRNLNATEPLSLLACKKPFTLAVKDFPTPTIVQAKGGGSTVLASLGLGGKTGPREDTAAGAAHSLGEWLRKGRIDAYVLHTKYTSIVCVGNFDSPDDPNLRTMKTLLETRVMPQIAQYFPVLPNQTMVQARVETMQIPR